MVLVPFFFKNQDPISIFIFKILIGDFVLNSFLYFQTKLVPNFKIGSWLSSKRKPWKEHEEKCDGNKCEPCEEHKKDGNGNKHEPRKKHTKKAMAIDANQERREWW